MESSDNIATYQKDISIIPGFIQLPNDTHNFNVDWRRGVHWITGYIQFFYVSVVALVLIVDAVGMYKNIKMNMKSFLTIFFLLNCYILFIFSTGTLTFRWKEYGELTHYQADSTSIVFLFTHSRWLLRVTIGKYIF